MEMRQMAMEKKEWIKPQVLERSSVSNAQASKRVRIVEAVVIIGTVEVAVGPAS